MGTHSRTLRARSGSKCGLMKIPQYFQRESGHVGGQAGRKRLPQFQRFTPVKGIANPAGVSMLGLASGIGTGRSRSVVGQTRLAGSFCPASSAIEERSWTPIPAPSIVQFLDTSNLPKIILIARTTRRMEGNCNKKAHAGVIAGTLCEEIDAIPRGIRGRTRLLESLVIRVGGANVNGLTHPDPAAPSPLLVPYILHKLIRT